MDIAQPTGQSRPYSPAWTALGIMALVAATMPLAGRAALLGVISSLLIGAQPASMPDQFTGMNVAFAQEMLRATAEPHLSPYPMYEEGVVGGERPKRLTLTRQPPRANLADLVIAALPQALQVPDTEALCLTNAIYFEARGEPLEGQLAVAQVVVNRQHDWRYPDNICGVVFEHKAQASSTGCQFSFTCDGTPLVVHNPRAWLIARAVAEVALAGAAPDMTGGRATHYHAYWVAPQWSGQLQPTRMIGSHIFYR